MQDQTEKYSYEYKKRYLSMVAFACIASLSTNMQVLADIIRMNEASNANNIQIEAVSEYTPVKINYEVSTLLAYAPESNIYSYSTLSGVTGATGLFQQLA